MDLAISQEEKLLFEKLKSLREIIGHINPETPSKVDGLYIREIIYNYMSQKGLNPKAGEFDALADDIEGYINKSFDDFVLLISRNKA